MAVLTLEEISSVDTIAALRNLYEERGNLFRTEKDFLKKVSKDMGELAEAYGSKPDMKVLPHLELTLEGMTYRMFGLLHGEVSKDKYRQLIIDSFDTSKEFLFEQNLKSMYNLEHGIEVAELSILPSYEHFLDAFKEGFRSLKQMYEDFIDKRYTERQIIEELTEGDLPSQLDHDLPAYVEIELAERSKVPKYNQDQRRSAYMAEFMRAWDNGADVKNIVTGGYHTAEIYYFLKHGVADRSIADKARQDAELLKNDPEAYLQLVEYTSPGGNPAWVAGEMLGSALVLIPAYSALYLAANKFFTFLADHIK